MNKKVLIIEDDDDILESTAMVLNIANFDVIGVNETTDIIGLVKIHNPDIILTDYMLPGLTGGQICTLIKTTKETEDIPVVLMSAYSKQAIAIGNFKYDAFVKKPFDTNNLVAVINKYIKL